MSETHRPICKTLELREIIIDGSLLLELEQSLVGIVVEGWRKVGFEGL